MPNWYERMSMLEVEIYATWKALDALRDNDDKDYKTLYLNLKHRNADKVYMYTTTREFLEYCSPIFLGSPLPEVSSFRKLKKKNKLEKITTVLARSEEDVFVLVEEALKNWLDPEWFNGGDSK